MYSLSVYTLQCLFSGHVYNEGKTRPVACEGRKIHTTLVVVGEHTKIKSTICGKVKFHRIDIIAYPVNSYNKLVNNYTYNLYIHTTNL